MAECISMPWDTDEIHAKLKDGWCVAYPPQDYKGSIAAWCVEMASRGYPEEYEALTWIMIPDRVWWEVLEACEGVPKGECSIRCDDFADGKHHETCQREKP